MKHRSALGLRHFSLSCCCCCCSNTLSLRAPFYTIDPGIRLNILNSDLLPQTPVSNGSVRTLLLGHFLLFQGLHHLLQSVCSFPCGHFLICSSSITAFSLFCFTVGCCLKDKTRWCQLFFVTVHDILGDQT